MSKGQGLKRQIGPIALLFTGHHWNRRVGLALCFALCSPARRARRHLLLVHRWDGRGAARSHLCGARRHAPRGRRHRPHPLLLARRNERLHGWLAVLDRLRCNRPDRGVGRAAVCLQLPALAHRDQKRRPGADAERPSGRGGAAARIPAREPRRRALAGPRQYGDHRLEARYTRRGLRCAPACRFPQRQFHRVRLCADRPRRRVRGRIRRRRHVLAVRLPHCHRHGGRGGEPAGFRAAGDHRRGRRQPYLPHAAGGVHRSV